MHQKHYTLARGLVFAILCFSLSPVATLAVPFDLSPNIVKGRDRVEEIESEPLYRDGGKVRKDLSTATQKANLECQKPNPEFEQTKEYLQTIVEHLLWNSELAMELKSKRGACVAVTNQSRGSFGLGGLFDNPMVIDGVINIPAKFILKLKREEELAFTLAHELSHVLLKHEIYAKYLQRANHIDDKEYMRMEREADEFGMHLLVNSGYDLNLALGTLKVLRAEDPMHADGKELDKMRVRVLEELKMREVSYYGQPRKSYLTPEVRAEIQNALIPKVSASAQ